MRDCNIQFGGFFVRALLGNVLKPSETDPPFLDSSCSVIRVLRFCELANRLCFVSEVRWDLVAGPRMFIHGTGPYQWKLSFARENCAE